MRDRLQAEATTLKASVRAQRVRNTIALFSPPPMPALSDINFIEFAADAGSLGTLDALLQQLGFRRVGQHRSKAVMLYRQGELHLIVNAQPGSFTRRRFDAHGTSACALGIRIGDPLGAAARATAMRSQRHDSPLGPDEVQVPTIVAPDSNLAHFVCVVVWQQWPV